MDTTTQEYEEAQAPHMTTMDRETERAVDDIRATLLRMEGKLDALIPQTAAQNERIKALESQLKWMWGVLAGIIVAIASQIIHIPN